MPETMRCITIHEHGNAGKLRLEQCPRPEIGDGEVLVAVHGVGINPIDYKMRDGLRRRGEMSFPLILGWDVSGVVAATKAAEFAVGDAVFGLVKFPKLAGAYADYVAAPAADLAPKPAGIDHLHAAAVPLAALTAWQALFDNAKLQAGQKVLIQAAAGGVGHFAVQFAKWKGAEVVATASARNADFVRGLGAAEVIDYTTTDVGEAVSGMDVVLHSLGPDLREAAYKTLKPGGILVSLLMPEPTPAEAEAHGVRAAVTLVHPDGGQMREIAALIDAGAVAPHIDKVFPLEETAAAHRHVEGGHTRGKVVLQVAG